jgi:uncharacterized phiE125 gp8 family phage protein
VQHVAVITPPEGSPLSLSLAKAQCRVDASNTDDDVLIQSLIDTATAWIDGPGGWLGRCLMPQTLELRLDSFYENDWRHRSGRCIWEQGGWDDWARWPMQHRIKLPYPPFISLISITYEDINGVDQVLTSTGWNVDAEGDLESAWDVPWPAGRVDADAVRIQYAAGYPTGPGAQPVPTVPAPIIHALKMLVSHWYQNREAVVGVDNRDSSTEIPIGVENLLAPLRVWNV